MFTLYGEYIQHYGGEIWVGNLIQLMDRFGISESSVRGAIFRMEQKDFLNKRKIKNKSYYSVTNDWKKNIDDGVRRVYSSYNFAWDGNWRILTYSFPEEKRDLRNEIRKELSWMGFGMITNSTWISPNPLEEQVMDLIKNHELENNATFFSSSDLVSHPPEQLINRVWDLENISKRYELFINEYSQKLEELRNKAFNDTLTDEQCFVERTSLVHEYRKFLFEDPVFPMELLPDFWEGTRAHELFWEIHQLLALPAVRYFESIFQSPEDSTAAHNRNKATNPFAEE